ncbi:MAG TPA: ABC transporter substrate-binding protein [Verrucomicrobiae bacterium]|jgi:polar amino acid transport system substrate-binding protein|nr:ABC transporter substrate-binding protein [Verrucomicrobiae bacterium]
MNFFTVWKIALIGLWMSAATFAAETAESDSSMLRVGVSPVFPPMIFKQGKELAGVEIELARQFAQETGREVTFVVLPWEDQIEALGEGKIDIVMSSMSITAARKWVVDFSRPYLLVGQMTLVRREDLGKYILGFPLKPPGTVGVLKATTGEFLVHREFPKAKRKTYATEVQAVQALQKKKIDLFISDSSLICYLAGTHASEGLAAVPLTLSQEPLGWAVRKGNEKLLESANSFLKKASDDGRLNQILRRWMAVPE